MIDPGHDGGNAGHARDIATQVDIDNGSKECDTVGAGPARPRHPTATQCITSFGPAQVAGAISPPPPNPALKCLASNSKDVGRNLATILAKAFPKVATEDLGKLAGRVGGHLWQVWAAGVVFGVATWFANQKLDGAAWTLNVFPKAPPPPPPPPSFIGAWSVHGSSLSVLSIDSAASEHEESNLGLCAPVGIQPVRGPGAG